MSEDLEPDITPLEVQPVSCHESFKHHDVHPDIVKEGSKLARLAPMISDLAREMSDISTEPATKLVLDILESRLLYVFVILFFARLSQPCRTRLLTVCCAT